MSVVQFKLTNPNGITRRLFFNEKPSWLVLSTKIESLFDIPIHKVAVSYLDTENDLLTLSSEEELQDFYKFSHQTSLLIKFIVQDLRTNQDAQYSVSKGLPEAPRSTDIRNTFGGIDAMPLTYEVEGGWENLGRMAFLPQGPMLGGSAFVEVADSDVSSVVSQSIEGRDNDSKDKDPSMESEHGHLSSTSLDKGKQREYECSISDKVSSTGSVLAAKAPPKFPVHVYDMNQSARISSPAPSFHPSPSWQPTVVVESTPKGTIDTLETPVETDKPQPPLIPTSNETVADPPLPTIDSLTKPSPTPSLTNDVASLLNSFTNILSSHPELSEGFRNIVQNATNGAYWSAHREAMARAAEDITRQTSEIGTNVEEEAGRRVAEALGSVIRAVAEMTNNVDIHASNAEANRVAPLDERPIPPPQTAPWSLPWSQEQSGILPAHPPRSRYNSHPHPHFHGFGDWRHPRGPPIPGNHPPPPPPGRPFPPPPPPPPGRTFPHPPPPPPPPPFPGMHFPPPSHRGFFPHPGELRHSWGGPHNTNDSKQKAEELKGRVEAAKQQYKMEKERYRREREQRRMEREKKLRGIGDITEDAANASVKKTEASDAMKAPPTAQIISHSRGPYPQLEMVSVPRRHNTYSGPPTRRQIADQSNNDVAESRTAQRIIRRLGDMGFTENAYPTLQSRLQAQMLAIGVDTREKEDDIVTTLLEELLAMSPKPKASGSGLKKIPGGWN